MATLFVQARGDSLSYAVDNTPGNLLVCVYAWTAISSSSMPSAISVTDSAGNVWQQLGTTWVGTYTIGDNDTTQLALFIVPACLAGANTITLHHTGGAASYRETF